MAIRPEQTEKHLGDDARADAGEHRSAREFGLLEDVVPERRAALEADAELGQLAQLAGRQRLDAHDTRDVLP